MIIDQTTFSCSFQVWIELTLLFGRIPSIGMFVFAFTNVFKKILMFFLVYLPALLAFSLSFYLLLSHHDTGVFSDPVSALIKTFVMMLGEIEYEGNFAWTVTKDQGAQVRTPIHIIPRPATISTIFYVNSHVLPNLDSPDSRTKLVNSVYGLFFRGQLNLYSCYLWYSSASFWWTCYWLSQLARLTSCRMLATWFDLRRLLVRSLPLRTHWFTSRPSYSASRLVWPKGFTKTPASLKGWKSELEETMSNLPSGFACGPSHQSKSPSGNTCPGRTQTLKRYLKDPFYPAKMISVNSLLIMMRFGVSKHLG